MAFKPKKKETAKKKIVKSEVIEEDTKGVLEEQTEEEEPETITTLETPIEYTVLNELPVQTYESVRDKETGTITKFFTVYSALETILKVQKEQLEVLHVLFNELKDIKELAGQ